MKELLIIIYILFLSGRAIQAQTVNKETYLHEIKVELQKKWPHNHTINLVFHGHSVPSGYFNTPHVRTLQSYPQLTLVGIKDSYSTAVVNCITTAKGGENAEQGCRRFVEEVLIHQPDILFIDYALNDRKTGLKAAEEAWETMIIEANRKGIKIILLTPTPDLTENILDDNSLLELHSRQIRRLAAKYKIGLVDAYAAFKEKARNGEDMQSYMSQNNHPNEKGHQVVCELIMNYF